MSSRQMFYILIFGTLVISVLFCFGVFFFQLHRDRGVKGGYQVLSWNESQTQIIHALSTLSFNRLQYIYS